MKIGIMSCFVPKFIILIGMSCYVYAAISGSKSWPILINKIKKVFDPFCPKDSLRYDGKCIRITDVYPKQIPMTSANNFHLTVDNLPKHNMRILCAFTVLGEKVETKALVKGNDVMCPTPTRDLLPPLPRGEHHFSVRLSIRTADLAGTGVTLYDCGSYTSCTDCSTSPYPCHWCLLKNTCTHNMEEICQSHLVVSSAANENLIRVGPKLCPRIEPSDKYNPEIFVPSGSEQVIRLEVKSISRVVFRHPQFKCRFNIEGDIHEVNGKFQADSIFCDKVEFINDTPEPTLSISIEVVSGDKTLDNPDDVRVVVYRCEDMAKTCRTCLELPKNYACGWCQSQHSSACISQDECKSQSTGQWLVRRRECSATGES